MNKNWGLRKMLLFCSIIILCLFISMYYMNELKRCVDIFDYKVYVEEK